MVHSLSCFRDNCIICLQVAAPSECTYNFGNQQLHDSTMIISILLEECLVISTRYLSRIFFF